MRSVVGNGRRHILFTKNNIRDIAGLIRARNSGTALIGIGVGNLALVDNAIALFLNGDHNARERLCFSAQQATGQTDTFRISW